jgi:hypothetical protein
MQYLIPRKRVDGCWERVFAYVPVFTTRWRWWVWVEGRTNAIEYFEFPTAYWQEYRDIPDDNSEDISYDAM